MNQKTFYTAVATTILVATGWLMFSYCHKGAEGELCPFMILFGVPCPFCGLTHAVGYLVQGQWHRAIASNPLIMLSPLGLLFVSSLCDMMTRQNFSYRLFQKATKHRRFPWIVAILLLANWAYKIVSSLG